MTESIISSYPPVKQDGSLSKPGILSSFVEEPLYFGIHRNINNKLNKMTLPGRPNGLKNADKFYESVRKAAHSNWILASDAIYPMIIESVKKIPDVVENQWLLKFLKNPEQIKESLEAGDYVKFAELGRVNLETWLAFLTALSLEQQHSHEIELKWARSISSRALERFGMKREELIHIAKIKKALQPHVDQAFIKQLIFNDMFANNPNFILWPVQNDADQYVYDVTWPGGLRERIPYSRAFYPEFNNIALALESIATETHRLVDQDDLPESYRLLAESAGILIPMYGGKISRSRQIQDYLNKIQDFYGKISNAEWTAMLTGMDYALLGQMWVALNLTTRTSLTNTLDRKFSDPYRDNFVIEAVNFSGVKKMKKPPIFVITNNSASKLYWPELGVSGREYSFVNVNIIGQKADILYEETSNFFNKPISKDDFTIGQEITTHFHEGGHNIGNLTDIGKEKLIAIYGTDGLDYIIDELFSDHVGLLPYFDKIIEKGEPISPEIYIYSLIAGYYRDIAESEEFQSLDYEMYGLSGKIIISELCKSNSIKMENGKITIVQPEAGMRAIRDFALELKTLHNRKDLSPEKAKTFLDSVKTRIPTNGIYLEVIKLFRTNNTFTKRI